MRTGRKRRERALKPPPQPSKGGRLFLGEFVLKRIVGGAKNIQHHGNALECATGRLSLILWIDRGPFKFDPGHVDGREPPRRSTHPANPIAPRSSWPSPPMRPAAAAPWR